MSFAVAILLPLIWLSLQFGSSPLWAAESSVSALLEVDTPLSREGYFVLSWTLNDRILNESASPGPVLQQASAADFSNSLTIPVPASGSLTLTGFSDGLYYFRVGSDGQWSPVREVQVAHHDLSAAFTWFATGAALFLVLVGVILLGAVRNDRQEKARDARAAP